MYVIKVIFKENIYQEYYYYKGKTFQFNNEKYAAIGSIEYAKKYKSKSVAENAAKKLSEKVVNADNIEIEEV